MAPQFYSPDIALCSVFDGTSGDFAAHFAANYLPQFLYNTQEMNALYTFTNNKAFLNMPIMKVYETVAKLSEIALRKSFLHLDAVLLQQLQDAELSYTASTNVTLLLWKNLLTVAHLGDSRACIFRETSDGFFSPQWLTVDHKPNHAPEHQRIAQSGGVLSWNSKKPYLRAPDFNEKHMAGKHPKKLNYSRGFGGVELKKYGFIADPEVHHFEICPSDKFLVLATDGLWDVLTPGHVANIIMTSKAKGLCVTSEIIKTAIEEMPDQLINDNISVVVIFL
jgi:protein phosphatase